MYVWCVRGKRVALIVRYGGWGGSYFVVVVDVDVGSRDAERSIAAGQKRLDAERVEATGLVRRGRRRGRGGQVQQRGGGRRGRPAAAVGGRRPRSVAVSAAAAVPVLVVVRTAAAVVRGRAPTRGRDGRHRSGRGRGRRPGVRRQALVLVVGRVRTVRAAVVVERGACAPPVPVVVVPVEQPVLVLLPDHVDLLVPARPAAATARRVVKRQVHAGV